MSAAVIALGFLGLAYVHVGYGALLHLVAGLVGRSRPAVTGFSHDQLPTVTILISAFNEEGKLAARIANLARLCYPLSRLEVLIVSDGSTDGTVEEAHAGAALYPDLQVRIVDLEVNQGRHAAQNLAAREAEGEIIVTSDADSEFAPDFIDRITEPFADPRVAVVGGEKHYPQLTSGIARSIGVYQRVEYWTRRGEDRWGLMAKTDGPCTAFRRAIWSEHEEFEDVDHSVVALAWSQGFIARHATDAVCYERPNERVRQEVRARARMTRKGFFTILKRWPPRMVLTEPAKTFALYSHRYARYCSPAFLTMVVGGVLWKLLANYGAAGVAVALIGAILVSTPNRVPVLGKAAQVARAFLVANWGFAIGLLGVMRGDRSGRYRPTHGAGG